MNNPYDGYYQAPQGQAGVHSGQAAQYYNPYPAGYSQYPAYPAAQQSWGAGWLDFGNPSYLKGLLLAAGVTLLVVNPTVQKTVLTGLAKAWSGMQYGLEEVKEQINDIKAEMQYKKEQKAAAQNGADDA